MMSLMVNPGGDQGAAIRVSSTLIPDP